MEEKMENTKIEEVKTEEAKAEEIQMEEPVTELSEQFVRIGWLLHRHHHRNHRAHGPSGDATRGQGRVLSLLKLKPEITQKELSYLLEMRSQSLGEMLGKLERSGYITRTPSEADRRVMDIRLTEEGVQATNQAENQPTDYDAVFACLTEDEQKTLGDYLNRIMKTLAQQLADEPAEHHGHGHHEHHGHEHGRCGFGERGERGAFPQRPGFDERGERGAFPQRPGFDERGERGAFPQRPGFDERGERGAFPQPPAHPNK